MPNRCNVDYLDNFFGHSVKICQNKSFIIQKIETTTVSPIYMEFWNGYYSSLFWHLLLRFHFVLEVHFLIVFHIWDTKPFWGVIIRTRQCPYDSKNILNVNWDIFHTFESDYIFRIIPKLEYGSHISGAASQSRHYV